MFLSNPPVPAGKYMGGKRRLRKLIQKIMIDYDLFGNRVISPFFGMGAVECTFDIPVIGGDMNHRAVRYLNYITTGDFVGIYRDVELWMNTMNRMTREQQVTFYKARRDEINKAPCTTENARLWLFLNYSGFNGLIRVNNEDEYNVPIGKPSSGTYKLPKIERFLEWIAWANEHLDLSLAHYQDTYKKVQPGDIVVCDSPYYGVEDAYIPGGFPEDDHIEVRDYNVEAVNNGACVIVSNSDNDFIEDIYADWPMFLVENGNPINSDITNRKGVTERVIVMAPHLI